MDIPNNLSSPVERGAGTVAQEEAPNKMAPIIKTDIDKNLIIPHLYNIAVLPTSSAHPPPSPSLSQWHF
jgi:hypothetical protein